MPHPHVLQDGVAQVDAHVGVVGAGRLDQLELALLLELPDDVGRQLVDDDVDRALAQLEAAHDVVGNDLENHAGIARRATKVGWKPLEHEPVIGRVTHETVGPGTDRMVAEIRPGTGRYDRHDQVDGKRSERLLQLELDGAIVDRADGIEQRVGALAR